MGTKLLAILGVFAILHGASAQTHYKNSFGAGALYFMPTEAKVEKLNPFWGGGVSWAGGNLKWLLGACVGKIEKKFDTYGSLGADDVLAFGSVNYLFKSSPSGALDGLYGSVGFGYYMENAEFNGRLGSYEFKETLKANSLGLEGGVGYFLESGDLHAKYVFLTSSKNVTGAIMFSFMLFLSGDK